MRIYGDESGDPGMGTACSPRFTLAFVLFETNIEADVCSQAIEQVKARLRIPEFHWTDLHDEERSAFFETVSTYKFNYVVQTLVKERVASRDFSRRAFFYERVAETMAEGIEEYVRSAAASREPEPLTGYVKLDTNADPSYRRAMERYLKGIRDLARRPFIKKVSIHRSKSENLIQLADMVCGAARHKHWHGTIEGKALSDNLEWP